MLLLLDMETRYDKREMPHGRVMTVPRTVQQQQPVDTHLVHPQESKIGFGIHGLLRSLENVLVPTWVLCAARVRLALSSHLHGP